MFVESHLGHFSGSDCCCFCCCDDDDEGDGNGDDNDDCFFIDDDGAGKNLSDPIPTVETSFELKPI